MATVSEVSGRVGTDPGAGRDSELKTAGWVVVDGSRIRREYFITPGRIEGLGRHASPVGLLFRSDGGTSSVSSVSYVFDANGNVSELLTDTGKIAAHYVQARRKSDCRRENGRNVIYEQVVLPERGCLLHDIAVHDGKLT